MVSSEAVVVKLGATLPPPSSAPSPYYPLLCCVVLSSTHHQNWTASCTDAQKQTLQYLTSCHKTLFSILSVKQSIQCKYIWQVLDLVFSAQTLACVCIRICICVCKCMQVQESCVECTDISVCPRHQHHHQGWLEKQAIHTEVTIKEKRHAHRGQTEFGSAENSFEPKGDKRRGDGGGCPHRSV